MREEGGSLICHSLFSPGVLWLLSEQSLLDPTPVLLLAPPLVVDKEVNKVEGVMEQSLLDLFVQRCVCVKAWRVVDLRGCNLQEDELSGYVYNSILQVGLALIFIIICYNCSIFHAAWLSPPL